MQLHGRSRTGRSGAAGTICEIDFIWQDASLPNLPAHLSEVCLKELGSPAQSPRRFELCSSQIQQEFSARAVQLHRATGRTMFAAVPAQPVPPWLLAAWWLLLSVLRIPGVGRLLVSPRSAA